MSDFLAALHRGQLANRLRRENQSTCRQEYAKFRQRYGRLAGVILWLQNYTVKLKIGPPCPIEIIELIFKIALDGGSPHYLHHGIVSGSQLPRRLLQKAPYSSYNKGEPQHNLAECNYVLGLSQDQIAVQFTPRANSHSNSFHIAFKLNDFCPRPASSLSEFLRGIRSFEQFKNKCLFCGRPYLNDPSFRYTCCWLDPRNDYYRLKQIWAVIQTVRAMIDIPIQSCTLPIQQMSWYS